MRRAPAWWRRFRARMTSYFWKPCPICGRMFAGYEKGHGDLWLEGDDHGRRGKITCPLCPGDHYAPSYDGPRFVAAA